MHFADHYEVIGGATFWGARQLADDTARDFLFASQLGPDALAGERGAGKPYGLQAPETNVLGGDAAQTTPEAFGAVPEKCGGRPKRQVLPTPSDGLLQ